VWEIPSESARRVNHPAPFPVELPERLIHLYTYRGDLVLDPFMGSGSTLVAAARTGRCYIGYDLEERYVRIAQQRVEEELKLQYRSSDTPESFEATATQLGKAAQAIAHSVLERAGFHIVKKNYRLPKLGVSVNFVAEDADGQPWYFDVTGAFTTTRGGLLRTDTLWKCLGRAHVIANNPPTDGGAPPPVVFLTSHLPKRGSEGDVALRAAGRAAFFDAIEMLSPEDQSRLAQYASGGHQARPLPGFWT
jgi:site-specific DNA-methyltransferase (adenine-specific)